MADFDMYRGSIDLNSEEWLDVGRQFSQFLPSHTMKVYQTLLQLEVVALKEQVGGVLEKASIVVIDDGCGGGSASIALLALILRYQKYKIANRMPLFPIKIDFIGTDPNINALKIYGKFLESCTNEVKDYLIDINIGLLTNCFKGAVKI